jgi:hypothetical protein
MSDPRPVSPEAAPPHLCECGHAMQQTTDGFWKCANRDCEGFNLAARLPWAAPPRATPLDQLREKTLCGDVWSAMHYVAVLEAEIHRLRVDLTTAETRLRASLAAAPSEEPSITRKWQEGTPCPVCGACSVGYAAPSEIGGLLEAVVQETATHHIRGPNEDGIARARAAVHEYVAALARRSSVDAREAERLREALEFYADPKTWSTTPPGSTHGIVLSDLDLGERARASLRATPPAEPETKP